MTVTTRERGTIPSLRCAGSNRGMMAETLDRIARGPSIDTWLAGLRANTRQSRINRGADPVSGEMPRRDDLGRVTGERVVFSSAGAARKR